MKIKPNTELQSHYRYEQVGDMNIFYREAGSPSNKKVLLLHGFAASSFMFRNLIPQLAAKYHVIAPDLPAFGFTEYPENSKYTFTFENIAETLVQFTTQLGLDSYAVMVHDYGAPVAWRMALKNPEHIKAIISQNGNAYEDGLGAAWDPIRAYWDAPTLENRNTLSNFPTPESIKWQYLEGVIDKSKVSPDGYTLESVQILKPNNADIQLDLILDYASNVAMYPKFQQYFRDYQPPLLAVWGANDPFFLPEGAEAWKRDIPNANIHFYETGHFALETHGGEINPLILQFLNNNY